MPTSLRDNNTLQASRAETFAKIQDTLAAGMRVQVSTHYKSTVYEPKHVGMFKLADGSLYVQRGKSWDCIDYCSIRFERKEPT